MIDELCPSGNWLLSQVLFEKSEVFKRLGYQKQNMGDQQEANEMLEKHKILVEDTRKELEKAVEKIVIL
jgi:hypothetical protein